MITSWISHGFDKVLGSAAVPENPKTSYTLYLAKNESECVHISFASDDAVQSIFLTVDGTHPGMMYAVYTETFIDVRGELYPDPLVPCNGTFDIAADRPTNVLIEFSADTAAAAGETTYTVTAVTADGETVGIYPITVRVWKFAPRKHRRVRQQWDCSESILKSSIKPPRSRMPWNCIKLIMIRCLLIK